jgi:hypothetical protein
MNRRVGALLAGTVAALACPGSAAGATFTAGCTASDGDEAGLIAAIGEANTVAGADVVQLGQGCVYRLTAPNNFWYGPTGLPAIGSDITIEGNGSTISRSPGSPSFRLFFVAGPGGSSELSRLPGPGTLTLREVTLTGGLAKGGDSNGGGGGAGMGGAIFSRGTVIVERSTRAGLVSWVVGRRSARTADGVTAIRVTVRIGRKRVRGQLKLLFDGPRTGTGELTMPGCRMFFKTEAS